MRSSRFTLTLVLLASLPAAPAGCSSDSPAAAEGGPSGAADARAQSAGDAGASRPDATASDAGDEPGDDAETPTPPQANVRFAHLSPDAPAIDLCLAPHGTADFQGPLLGPLALATGTVAGDAGAILSYPQVSAYFGVDAGQYDVRVVAAGAISCAIPLARGAGALPDDGGIAPDDGAADPSIAPDSGFLPDAVQLPALAANTYTTIMAVGEMDPSGGDSNFSWSAVTDDAVLVGGAAVLRAVNAQPSVALEDFGLGTWGGSFLPLLVDVPFGQASMEAAPNQGAVDLNGYLPIAALSPQAVSCRPSRDASANSAVASAFSVDLGSIATLFSIGGDAAGTRAPALLLCIDNEPAGGALADCSVIP